MADFSSHLLRTLAGEIDQTQVIFVFALIAMRMAGMIQFVPFLGSKNAPSMIKIAFAIFLSLLVFPAIYPSAKGHLPPGAIAFFLLLLKEFFIGMCIGIVTSEIFYIMEMAGQLIDVFRGANQIQAMVPETADRSSAFGTLGFQMTLALFLAANFHVIFFEALIESFSAAPVHQFPAFSHGFSSFIDVFIHVSSFMFTTAVTLAFPVAIVSLVVDTGFGLLNRVAPQINAYFMSMPAKTLGGMIIFFVGFTMLLEQQQYYSGEMLTKLFELIGMLK